MTTQPQDKPVIDTSKLLPHLPGTDQTAKLLIAAVLAAGQNGCSCTSCQLLKKFGGAMSEVVLKEVSGD